MVLASLIVQYPALPQEKVQVVTKHVDKRLDYTAGDELVIMAEKSKVKIMVWDKNYIELNLALTSKHSRLETATKELDYLRYKIEQQGSRHIIKNYFQPKDDFTRVKGSLSSVYTVKVPAGCPVSVTNLYGELVVSGLKSRLDVQVRFVDVQIQRVAANIKIESYFGNIRLEDGNGQILAVLEKSNMNLIDFVGELDIKSSYGEVQLERGQYKRFDITGERTAITLAANMLNAYNYNLSTYASDIFLPEDLGKAEEKAKEITFIKKYGDHKTSINIKTTFSPITIKLSNYNVSSK